LQPFGGGQELGNVPRPDLIRRRGQQLGLLVLRVPKLIATFPDLTDVRLPAQPVPEGLDWDLWLGPAPWRPFNGRFHIYGRPPHVVPWHFCRDFGGGNLASNAVHAFDVVQWGLGMDSSGPVEIVPRRPAGRADELSRGDCETARRPAQLPGIR